MTALAVVLLTLLAAANAQLRIGSFNIQSFGSKKMSKPGVVNILKLIIQRYDIVMIQEIRDKHEEALPALVKKVNENQPLSQHYGYRLCDRQGTTNYKEQYGFVYRMQKVQLDGAPHEYVRNPSAFERPPCAAVFKKNTGKQRSFSYIAIHTKPKNAANEILALLDVYEEVKNKNDDEDALIGGDFNAAYPYVKKGWLIDEFNKLARQKFHNKIPFKWLIGDDVDTSVGKNHRAYDRLIVAGRKMVNNSVKGGVFNYTAAYGLTYKQTKAVSDHYPVEFYLL